MIVFINGGSGSGKSAFAETFASRLGGRLVYVATMPVVSKEDEQKVKRHCRLREGKGFETLERPKLFTDMPDHGETVLIECMSTHTANVLFDPEIRSASAAEEGTDRKARACFEQIRTELQPILNRSGHTVFVSAEVGMDGAGHDPETETYRQVLTDVNRYLMEQADAAYEVVCGIPVTVKGEEFC